MSPRAACRLATLGFEPVYDYMPGKVDWLARNLPTEGTDADRPTAGTLAREDVATSSLEEPIAEVLRRIDGSPYGFALVLGPARILLGRARRSQLQGANGDQAVESLMEPGPSTIRAHLTIDELQRRLQGSEVNTLVVTNPEGELIGVVRRADVAGLDAPPP
jgi:CBS domain-containing protein